MAINSQLNQFAMNGLKGSIARGTNPFTVSVVLATGSADVIPGDFVTLYASTTSKVILVSRCAATDVPCGVVLASPKKQSWTVGEALEIGQFGTMVMLEASGTVTSNDSLEFVPTGSKAKTNAGVNPIMGVAYTGATTGNLFVAFIKSSISFSPTITAGSINNSPIGAGTPSTGAFTTLSATTSFTLSRTLAANPGAAVIPHNVTIIHSAGAGDCDDLVSSYAKADVQGAGDAGLTAVGSASRAYVGVDGSNAVAAQAYGTQAWAKHDGTGAITAMSGLSALVDVNTGNFTASTVNAGHFHIEGAATVTGQFDGVMIEAYPDVTCLDSGLAIAVDAGAVVDAGIRITGAPRCSVKLESGAKIFTGTAANETAVYAEVGAKDATGSIYISTAGGLYVQVANNGADADWQKVTSTHT